MSYRLMSHELYRGREKVQEMAKRHKGLDPVPGERPVDPKRTNFLKEEIAAQRVLVFRWAAANIAGSNVVYRVDGRHSSILADDPTTKLPSDVAASLDHYEVDSEEGLAELASCFDSPASARSMLDIFGFHQGAQPELHEVNRVKAKRATEGVAWGLKNVSKEGSVNPLDLFNDKQVIPFIKWFDDKVNITDNRKFNDLGIIAAMYYVTETSEQGRAFCETVLRGGEQTFNGEPHVTELLFKALESLLPPPGGWIELPREVANSESNKYAKASMPLRKLKERHKYSGFIYAWEAYRQGKSPSRIDFDVKDLAPPNVR